MKVHVNDPISEAGLDVLRDHVEVSEGHRDGTELRKHLSTCHGVVVRSATQITREVLLNAEYLKVVGRAGVGVDNIDLDACRDLGIAVVNAPTASSEAVAELTLAHMLGLARHLPAADASVKEGRWDKSELAGCELRGRTLGLVGSGRIGSRVAQLARAFGMDVLTFDPYITPDDAEAFGAELVEDLHGMLADSDVISVHCPLTDETRHILSDDEFEAAPDHAWVVNCARGGIVDEDALARALQEGEIGAAALDVFETEPPTDSSLLDLDGVQLTPHLGAATEEAQRRVGVICAEQVVAVLDGREAEFRVV